MFNVLFSMSFLSPIFLKAALIYILSCNGMVGWLFYFYLLLGWLKVETLYSTSQKIFVFGHKLKVSLGRREAQGKEGESRRVIVDWRSKNKFIFQLLSMEDVGSRIVTF